MNWTQADLLQNAEIKALKNELAKLRQEMAKNRLVSRVEALEKKLDRKD